MADWVCPNCGKGEPHWWINLHECKPSKICPDCNLTKPCECDD